MRTVESLEIKALLAGDFGDAPSPYPVTLIEDGARHTVTVSSPRFGATIDTEADGVHSALADADGTDEDGITIAKLYAGRSGSVAITAQNVVVGGAKVDAWLDFNSDGDWSDAGEQIFTGLSVTNGQNSTYEFSIPGTATIGYTFARFRISTDGGLSPTGSAADGEVQDYRTYIGFPSPVVTSPVDSTVVNVTGTNRVTFNWGAVDGAVNYDFWLNYNSQNQWHRATVSGTSYTPNLDFGIGNYTLYMRSFGSGNLVSAWSPARSFQVTSKVTVTPMAPIQNTLRPTISWSPVIGATEYRVWISDLGTGRVYRQIENVTTTSYTPTEDIPLGKYRVWVSVQVPILWSTPVDFQIAAAPTPTTGINSTFDRTPTFGWSNVPGAATYELQVKNLNTGILVVNQTGIAGTSYTPGSNLTDGPYRWWVRAKTSGNLYSSWSAANDIYVGGRTSLLSPTGSVNDTTPTFTWGLVNGAARYELWVTTTAGTLVINKTDLTTAEYTPAAALAAGNYRAWVRAVSTTNEFSPWSIQANFSIASTEIQQEHRSQIPVLDTVVPRTLLNEDFQEHRKPSDRTEATNFRVATLETPPDTDENISAGVMEHPVISDEILEWLLLGAETAQS